MEAADASRVLALFTRIQELRQAVAAIDDGATITAMTLTRPERLPPEPDDEDQRPETTSPPEEGTGREDDELPSEDEGHSEVTEPGQEEIPASEVTISTAGLTYPPQMMQAIRSQEIQLWQTAYDALAQFGVTNVPQPPTEARPLPGEVTPEPTGPAPPSTRPTPPRQPHRGRR